MTPNHKVGITNIAGKHTWVTGDGAAQRLEVELAVVKGLEILAELGDSENRWRGERGIDQENEMERNRARE